jgi:ElaB/YqjD/DUF883 family membrane-anchored ribosome-binding protein
MSVKDGRMDPTDGVENDESIDDSLYSVKGAAKKAKGAVKDTAQQYLDTARMGFYLEDIEEGIRDRPYYSLAIAASAGFLLGGGLTTTPGIALLTLFGRKAARDTASNLGRQVFGRTP